LLEEYVELPRSFKPALQVVKNFASSSPWQLLPSLAEHCSYMHTQNIDYAAIKNRLKSLQPKNRADTRYAHLAELKEELRDARKRGVSVNTLSAELKAAGITISSAALAKYLSRRSSSSPTKRPTTAANLNHVPEPHDHVKMGTRVPEQRESETGPK
jgi:hypothetical protein